MTTKPASHKLLTAIFEDLGFKFAFEHAQLKHAQHKTRTGTESRWFENRHLESTSVAQLFTTIHLIRRSYNCAKYCDRKGTLARLARAALKNGIHRFDNIDRPDPNI